MGRTIVYTRTSYKIPFSADAETRIYSGKIECALINLINLKINNGIKDDIYTDARIVSDRNKLIGIILKDNLAVISCYDKERDILLPELPDHCFNGMDNEHIHNLTCRITRQIEDYVRSHNHQNNGIDMIQNRKPPLLSEKLRNRLEELAKSIDIELANRHIIFDNYPPIPEQFKDR